MPPSERDLGYLWDMLDAARTVRTFTNGVTLEAYSADRQLQLAIERLVEIIGEAARQVSPDFQREQVAIPWRAIIAQRHILAHDYGEVKHDRLWRVATQRIPELITLLEPLVPADLLGDE